MKLENNYHSLTNSVFDNVILILKSMLVGVCAGGIAVLYRLVLGKGESFAFSLYDFVSGNLLWILLLIPIFGIVAYLIGKMVDYNPMISGSGIPQIEGILKGYFLKRKSWFSTLVCKFAGGAMGIAGGLSLGREGPSIQLGANVGEAIGNRLGNGRLEKKILIAGGASAGLAAAFNAPLAGVMFALEEIFKYFTPVILLSMMSAAVASDFISKQIFGMQPIFELPVIQSIPLSGYGYLILLGILLGVFGAIYNYVLLRTKDLYKSLSLPTWVKIWIPFLLAIVLGITMPQVLGGGHALFEEMNSDLVLTTMIVFLLVKFLFSVISFGSGIPGGIFFPLIVLGAGIGSVYAKAIISFLGVDPILFHNFIILAMAGYFTAIVRAPLTGIILVTEMTNSLAHLLSLTVVSLVAYAVADLLKSPPVYEALLDGMLDKEQGEPKESGKRIVFEILVQHESMLANKMVKDIPLPEGTLLVEIRRGEYRILPKGNTKIKEGDTISVLTDVNLECSVKEALEAQNQST